MNELKIPNLKGSLPVIEFDAKAYRVKVQAMSSEDLDVEIDRTLTAGMSGLTDFTLAYRQNVIARHERGKGIEKQAGGRGKKLSSGNDSLTPTQRNQRSEDMLIAEQFTDEELDTELETAKGVAPIVTKARAKRRESQVADTTATTATTAQDWQEGPVTLLRGDFRDRLSDLPDGSVDLIITDPPYPHEDIELWSDLAEVSARILSPRGILFAMSGQMYLPEVMDRLAGHLNYGWIYNLPMSGGASRIMGRHIIQTWKPMLGYTKGRWPSGEWGPDTLLLGKKVKMLYKWQQSHEPIQDLIERFTAPDALVVDPMMGVGSFGIAAQEAGRRFIGVEIDEGRFATSIERIQGKEPA